MSKLGKKLFKNHVEVRFKNKIKIGSQNSMYKKSKKYESGQDMLKSSLFCTCTVRLFDTLQNEDGKSKYRSERHKYKSITWINNCFYFLYCIFQKAEKTRLFCNIEDINKIHSNQTRHLFSIKVIFDTRGHVF